MIEPTTATWSSSLPVHVGLPEQRDASEVWSGPVQSQTSSTPGTRRCPTPPACSAPSSEGVLRRPSGHPPAAHRRARLADPPGGGTAGTSAPPGGHDAARGGQRRRPTSQPNWPPATGMRHRVVDVVGGAAPHAAPGSRPGPRPGPAGSTSRRTRSPGRRCRWPRTRCRRLHGSRGWGAKSCAASTTSAARPDLRAPHDVSAGWPTGACFPMKVCRTGSWLLSSRGGAATSPCARSTMSSPPCRGCGPRPRTPSISGSACSVGQEPPPRPPASIGSR